MFDDRPCLYAINTYYPASPAKKIQPHRVYVLLIVYLFFLIYQKSKVWTITRIEKFKWCVC